ncbi:MAG TPA: hypothetical protein VKA53_10505 [Thermoanaerobaculia bacterium]|nr:hypothetical protein [Thermoanaerobaculia bacterium]
MSEPRGTNMQAEEPEPFAGQPARAAGGGCGKPAWIGCGVVLVLLGILAIVFIFKSKDLFRWSIERVEANIMSKLPEGTTAAEKERLTAAFSGAINAVTNGKANPADIEELQSALMHAAESTKNGLSHEDLQQLTVALEKVAGVSPPKEDQPAPQETPAPAKPQGPEGKTASPSPGESPGSLAA